MGRSRKVYEPTHPHFITCPILHWIPVFADQESMQIVLSSLKYLQSNYNLKFFAYVDEASHWRYSSARSYEDADGLLEIEKMF